MAVPSQNTVRTECFARAGKVSAEEFACDGPGSACPEAALKETRLVFLVGWSSIRKSKIPARNAARCPTALSACTDFHSSPLKNSLSSSAI